MWCYYFTKFHEYRTKNVDFILLVNFWMKIIFFTLTLGTFKPIFQNWRILSHPTLGAKMEGLLGFLLFLWKCTLNETAGRFVYPKQRTLEPTVPCRLNRLFGHLWYKVGVLWHRKNCLKSAPKHSFSIYPNKYDLDLSK